VFFTVHYLMLRGFYALEQNRTVFFVQCGIAATNVVVAVVLVSHATPAQTSPALVLAYLSSYVLGATASYLILRSRLGGLQTPQLVRFLVRLLVAATISTGVAWVVGLVLPGSGNDVSHVWAGVRLVVLGGVDVVVFLALARAMRLSEVTSLVDIVVRRLPGARHS
jgi:putative peptidoglycan lipid II flippase